MAKYIGIDITDRYISIYESEEGITLRERNCICVDTVTREYLAIGNSAKILADNTPGAVELITDIYTKDSMNDELLTMVISELFYKINARRPVVILATKKGDKPTRIAALANVIMEAGAREVLTLDMLSACALGSGVMINDKRCMLSCCITDEFSLLGIVKGCINKGSKTLPFSINKLLEVITAYIKNERNAQITRESAYAILEYAVSVRPEFEYEGYSFTGIDIITGLPVSPKLESAEIKELLAPYIKYLCDNISAIQTNLPATIKEEVADKGILLMGNISLVSMLKGDIESHTGLHVTISENNDNSSLMGIGTVIENLDVFDVMLKGIGDE